MDSEITNVFMEAPTWFFMNSTTQKVDINMQLPKCVQGVYPLVVVPTVVVVSVVGYGVVGSVVGYGVVLGVVVGVTVVSQGVVPQVVVSSQAVVDGAGQVITSVTGVAYGDNNVPNYASANRNRYGGGKLHCTVEKLFYSAHASATQTA